MARQGLYRGFSSFEYQREGTFRLTDVELVKLDLLNHIFTKRGERVRMPTFGTIIPDLVFEPLDEDTLDTLETELRFVFNYDPRVEILNFDVVPRYDENRVDVDVLLRYIELNTVDEMNLNLQFGDGGL